MISAISPIRRDVPARLARSEELSVGPDAEQDEKKKKLSIPSVEVTAAQAQALSSRVGDFLVNRVSQSSDGSTVAPGISGAGGIAPEAQVAGGPLPGTASGGLTDGGAGGQGGDGERGGAHHAAQSLLSLLAGNAGGAPGATRPVPSSQSATSLLSLLSGEDEAGDAGAASAGGASGPGQGANTQYAMRQGAGGVFGVQFDEIGAYRFAAVGG